MAATTGKKALQRQLRAKDHPVEVDVDHQRRGRVGFIDERSDRHHPGVVDQDVERAEPGLHLLQKRLEARRVRHVKR
jgi:hypothetical protein